MDEEHGSVHDIGSYDGGGFDSGVSVSDKYVSVKDGSRRLEVPDGEGYLKAIETTPSNDLPEGRYDLSKAIEANRQANHAYEGQVLHSDKESIYQLVGKEVVKHGLFEAAKHAAPEIGKNIAIAYASGVPAFVHPGQVPAKTELSQSAPADKADAATVSRADASKDVDALFRQDPRAFGATSSGQAPTNPALSQIEARANMSSEYAAELKKTSPDLFGKVATPDTQQIVKAIEVAERADQAKTVYDKVGGGEKGHEKNGENRKDEDGRESERRGFTTPTALKTTVEARAAHARDMINKIHTLPSMYARPRNSQQGHAQEQGGRQKTVKPKRGMSR